MEDRVAPAGADNRTKRVLQRDRRLEMFYAWSQGGTFGELGAKFGIGKARAREIIWRVIVFDGGRSARARNWMIKFDRLGGTDYVRKYDQEWFLPRKAPQPRSKGRRMI